MDLAQLSITLVMLSFVIQTVLHMFIRMTEIYPGSQVYFLAL